METSCCRKGAFKYGWKVVFPETVGYFVGDGPRAGVGFLGQRRLGRNVVAVVVVDGGALANVAVGCSGKGKFVRAMGLKQCCNLSEGSSRVMSAKNGNLARLLEEQVTSRLDAQGDHSTML